MSRRVNGWTSNINKFSDRTLSFIRARLPEQREQIKWNLPKKAEMGDRFINDERVILRICSTFTENEFLIDPEKNIHDALEECAISDYYYNKEKDWGYDDE